MKIFAYPHYVAEAYKPDADQKTVMIRVLEPEGKNAELQHPFAFADVLSVYFDDLTPQMICNVPDSERFKLISEEDARDIARFFIKHQDADVFIIHCHAGVSRSQAIALAFASYLKDAEMEWAIIEKYFVYNQFVYEAVMRELPDEEKRTLHCMDIVSFVTECQSGSKHEARAWLDWGTRRVFNIASESPYEPADVLDQYVVIDGGNRMMVQHRGENLYELLTECDECNTDLPAGTTIYRNESKYLYGACCADEFKAKPFATL